MEKVNFKYGQKVLVRGGFDWHERFFILEANGRFLVTIDGENISAFEDNSNCSYWWDECKAMPEKKYRAFTMEEFKEHKDRWVVSKRTECEYRVLCVNVDRIIISDEVSFKVGMQDLLNSYEFEDGSPCGVELVE